MGSERRRIESRPDQFQHIIQSRIPLGAHNDCGGESHQRKTQGEKQKKKQNERDVMFLIIPHIKVRVRKNKPRNEASRKRSKRLAVEQSVRDFFSDRKIFAIVSAQKPSL